MSDRFLTPHQIVAKQRYAILRRAARQGLSGCAWSVFIEVMLEHDGDRGAFMAVETLGTELDYERRQVGRALRELVDAKLLSRVVRPGRSSVYRVLVSEEVAPATEMSQACDGNVARTSQY